MIAEQFAGNERLREYLLGSDRVFDTESWKSKWFRGCYEDLSVLWQPRTNNATEGFNQKLKLEKQTYELEDKPVAPKAKIFRKPRTLQDFLNIFK